MCFLHKHEGWWLGAGSPGSSCLDQGRDQVWELREASPADFLELASGAPRLKAGRALGSERF